MLAVKSDYQNKGLGKALIDSVIAILIAKGIDSVSLEVRKDNMNAIRFYNRNGFEICGEKSDDSYLMVKQLV